MMRLDDRMDGYNVEGEGEGGYMRRRAIAMPCLDTSSGGVVLWSAPRDSRSRRQDGRLLVESPDHGSGTMPSRTKG
ncbi:hypothetical protein CPLU01_15092 [Colletotrichum plurivorum]|uniref:Uncharacterized protein n=1 Tax=Colletotrichum plurivorum TaxID=2175906 RepID=A0A8H6JF92_9PEZI|nr:hypothetical protein CPLU01_15092 [Colletotrichum plurivorum]